ncbi:MAG: hypothetical protein NXI04_05565 [Planctomycetaceae bacterium]|nr:hypothetical protein [Planctomycetaceae bacterium]
MPVHNLPTNFTRIALLATILLVSPRPAAMGQDSNIDLDRDGIVYVIGQVRQVINRAGLVDLGDAHTVRRAERLAVIRREKDHYVPIGVVTVNETYPTFCVLNPTPRLTVEVGDIVMTVREFSELTPPAQHQRRFIEQQIVKNSGANGYSTRLRRDTAATLLKYTRSQPRWEKQTNQILGYLNGASFSDGREKTVSRLIRHINMLRRDYREGRNSIEIMGTEWNSVMDVLFGRTVKSQHAASQVGDADADDGFADDGPTPRDITRIVDEKLFDRNRQERLLFKYIVAAALERSPRKLDLWVRQKAEQSQFIRLDTEDVVLDVVRKIIRDLKNQ